MLEAVNQPRRSVPRHLSETITAHKPEMFINLLRGVGEETPFRIKLIHLETRDKKSRLGHCPGVSLRMLTDGALALTVDEHREMQDLARTLIRTLDHTATVEVTSPAGTAFSLSTAGRPFYTDTLIDWKQMKWMNLPTGEVLAAPVEDSLQGTVVCDLAVGGVGPLREPIELTVHNGVISGVASPDQEALQQVERAFATDKWAKVGGEYAFGINPKATSLTEFLETEKINRTIHVAFGNNLDMPGGRNPSANHMDFLISDPTVKITKDSGETFTVMKDGKFKLK
jgi:leucyl aminopeptidase (aminopeptidase T)